MIIADWIAIGLVLVFCIIGFLVGFGGGLKFFTKGIFGIIISIVVCYFFLGVVLSWPFVQDLSAKINDAILGDGSSSFRVWIAESSFINKAVSAILVFIVVQILRIIIVNVLKSVLEIDNILFKIINKTLGIVFFVAVLAVMLLLVTHIITIVGGSTYDTIVEYLSGSALRLDKLFESNPLHYIIS